NLPIRKPRASMPAVTICTRSGSAIISSMALRKFMSETVTKLVLPRSYHGARRALTSIPWPAGRGDIPQAVEVEHQVVPLFEPALTPRLRRYLLLTQAIGGLP